LTSDRQVLVVGGDRVEIAAHNCFACGTRNEHGLRLDLSLEPGRASTDVTLDPRFEGWEGIAHGGILATILDEVMAWSLVATDAWGVTARMRVDFRAPVAIGERLRAEGRLVEARRRVFRTTGTVASESTGRIVATAEATYVAAPPDRKRKLQERYAFRRRTSVTEGPDGPGDADGHDPRIRERPTEAVTVGVEHG
jgi:uncharacterized protein (TIGR00369 family)